MNLVLVDGMNAFIRHFVANPTMDANGEPMGGCVGFIRGVKVLLREMRPDRLVVVWDGEGGSQRRRGIRAEYKAGRKVRLNREFDSDGGAREDGDNMGYQLSMTRKYLDLLGVTQVLVDAIEADDVLAYLCNFVLEDDTKTIVSADHDMYQMVNDKCCVYNPLKKEFVRAKQVMTKHGVLPENYIFVKALCGDASDNVRGLKGFGQKTVLKLFPMLAERIVSFEDVFAHAEANKNGTPKYRTVVEQRALVAENVELMQLSSPEISTQASRSIREQLVKRLPFSQFKTMLELVKDGLSITDTDFVTMFREHDVRQQRAMKENE